MRKMFYTMFIIALLITCSMLFVSCEAITAQNINTDSFSGFKGGGLDLNGAPGPRGINDNPGMNGSPSRNKNQDMKSGQSETNRNANGNFMGGIMNSSALNFINKKRL